MRTVATLFILILLAGSASASDAPPGADAGVVGVEIMASTPGEQCATPIPLQDLCLVHHDDGGTEEIGDDTATTSLYVDEVTVTARTPTTEDHQVRVDYKEVAVEHPGFQVLNQTWARANDTLPGKVKDVVTLESRPRRQNGDYTDDWGLFLMFHSPIGDPTGLLWEHKNLVHFCWSICELTRNERTDETHIRPFPDGIAAGYGSSTDHEVSRRPYELYHCFGADKAQSVCDHLTTAKPYTDDAYETYQRFTPSYGISMVQWNRTTVEIKPHHDDEGAPEEARVANLTLSHVPAQTIRRETSTVQTAQSDAPPQPSKSRDELSPGEPAPQWFTTLDTARTESTPPPESTWSSVVAVAAASLALTFVWWLLYSRVSASNALKQRTRRQIYHLIQAEPGIRVGTIADQLGLQYNTVKHHVRTLQRVGLVQASCGGQPRYFLAGSKAEAVGGPGSTTNATARRVLSMVQRQGRVPQREVARLLRMAPSTISDALRELEAAGHIVRQKEGRRFVVTAPMATVDARRDGASA